MRLCQMTIHCRQQRRRQYGRNRLLAVNFGAGLIMAVDKRCHTELDIRFHEACGSRKLRILENIDALRARSNRQNLLRTSVFRHALTGLCQQDADTIRFLCESSVTTFAGTSGDSV